MTYGASTAVNLVKEGIVKAADKLRGAGKFELAEALELVVAEIAEQEYWESMS